MRSFVRCVTVQRSVLNSYPNYKPEPKEIRHVDALLKVLGALSGDRRYEKTIPLLSGREGGVTMCDVLDAHEQIGMQKGIKQGQEKTAKLMQYLLHHKLYEEAQKAADHPEKLEEYYTQYGIV